MHFTTSTTKNCNTKIMQENENVNESIDMGVTVQDVSGTGVIGMSLLYSVNGYCLFSIINCESVSV